MAEDLKKRNKRNQEWTKNNMTQVLIKLHNVKDADIISILNSSDGKATEAKRLIRLGIYAKERNLIVDDIMRQIIE